MKGWPVRQLSEWDHHWLPPFSMIERLVRVALGTVAPPFWLGGVGHVCPLPSWANMFAVKSDLCSLVDCELEWEKVGKTTQGLRYRKASHCEINVVDSYHRYYLIISCRNHLWMHMVMERWHIWTLGWHRWKEPVKTKVSIKCNWISCMLVFWYCFVVFCMFYLLCK